MFCYVASIILWENKINIKKQSLEKNSWKYLTYTGSSTKMLNVYCLYQKKIMGTLFYIMRKLGFKSSKVKAELGLAFVLSIVVGHYYLCTIKLT